MSIPAIVVAPGDQVDVILTQGIRSAQVKTGFMISRETILANVRIPLPKVGTIQVSDTGNVQQQGALGSGGGGPLGTGT